MNMDFRVYQLTFAGDLTVGSSRLFEGLKNLPKSFGEHGLEYCITSEIDLDENIITGCLSEEYIPDIDSVDEGKNTFVPDVEPYLKTMFALDLQEKRMIVQHRQYPPTNLDRHQSMVRLSTLINSIWQDVYHVQFNYVITHRDVTDEDFLRIFNNNRVTMMRVRLFETGRYISDGAKIFESDELNSFWSDGWNSDESETYEILIKAPGKGGSGDLRKSPIARSLINLTQKEILQMNYWDGDGYSDMSRTDFKKFRVYGIDKNTQVITAISEIAREVYRRRSELREFRLIQDLE